MSGKRNNRLMLGVFLVLAALYVITRFTSKKQSDRSLRTELVQIDTSQVSSILLYPLAEQGAELKFTREGPSWKVERGDVAAAADAGSVEGMLSELMNLKTEQLITRSPERWADYQVDDSLGTRIVVKEGTKPTLDLVVGRFNYQPPPRNSYDPYRQNRVSGKTYVRLTSEEEVYSVEGFLAMSINQPFDRWRDQRVTTLNRAGISRIVYDYPADSGFIARKEDAGWMVSGVLADSASMAAYLNRVTRISHQEFVDKYQPEGEPDYRVSFEGDNMPPQVLKAYGRQGDQLILNSSINPDTWFGLSPEDDLFDDLFPGSNHLISE